MLVVLACANLYSHNVWKFQLLNIFANNWHCFCFFKNKFIYLFLFFAALGLCNCARAFSSCGERGLLFVVARGLQQLWHAGSVVVSHGLWSAGSVVVAHWLSCSAACGIFPDQGLNPCPLNWQTDSQPLRHQGSPIGIVLLSLAIWLGIQWYFALWFKFAFLWWLMKLRSFSYVYWLFEYLLLWNACSEGQYIF